jgi:hypothetical protein
MRRFAQAYKDVSRDKNGPAEPIARYHPRPKRRDVSMATNVKPFDVRVSISTARDGPMIVTAMLASSAATQAVVSPLA